MIAASNFEDMKSVSKGNRIEVVIVQDFVTAEEGVALINYTNKAIEDCSIILISTTDLTKAVKVESDTPIFFHLVPPFQESQLIHAVAAAKKHSQLKKTLRNYENQLILAKRREFFDSFINGIVHDLNNIFMIITGYVDLSVNQINTRNKVLQNFQRIKTISHKGESLCKRMLSDFNPRLSKVETISIQSVLNPFIVFFEKIIPDNISFIKTLPSEPYTVIVNPMHIEQVFWNICINAVQAMGGSTGSITFSLRFIDEFKLETAHLSHNTNGYIGIEISDTGCGIPEKSLSRIFDASFSTKSETGGVGLNITKRIVEDHGGKMTVFSQLGEGSQFIVYLPVA